jgi:hypothetical protein
MALLQDLRTGGSIEIPVSEMQNPGTETLNR